MPKNVGSIKTWSAKIICRHINDDYDDGDGDVDVDSNNNDDINVSVGGDDDDGDDGGGGVGRVSDSIDDNNINDDASQFTTYSNFVTIVMVSSGTHLVKNHDSQLKKSES